MLPFNLTSLLARRQTRHSRSLRAQEPADMGTAFGMEQWLDEREQGQASTPPARPGTAARVRWMPRWLQPSR